MAGTSDTERWPRHLHGFIVLAIAALSVVPLLGQPPAPVSMAEFWQEPRDLPDRDLFAGPWGLENAPDPQEIFAVTAVKTTGTNPGLVVSDSRGREWHVKQGSEGQPEVIVSRLLSALGYHQPPVYYLPSFKARTKDGFNVESGARFRLTTDTLKKSGLWKWEDNPFVGTPPYRNLLVVLVIVSNGDMKDVNNVVYEVSDSPDGVQRWFVVRDLGSSLGKLRRFISTQNNPREFSRQPFILGVSDDGYVRFDFPAVHSNLMKRITPAEVRAACEMLARLSDRQWNDAFRAGGYSAAGAAPFIQRIHQKIDDGLQVGLQAGLR